ncbi:MAG: primosomal protein N' [Clostridia bacterium]|nr:primosomal protein N' [Clostridia bacterium]
MDYQAAKIAIDGAVGSFDKLYSYLLLEPFARNAQVGCRVTVPFGRGNRTKQGMIFALETVTSTEKIKPVLTVTDEVPILNAEQIQLCFWLKEHTFCSYFDAVHLLLPVGLEYRLNDFFSVSPEFVAESMLTGQEKALFDFLKRSGETERSKLEKLFEQSEEVIASLLFKEAILRDSVPMRRMNDLTRRCVRLCCSEAELETVKLTSRQKEIAKVVAQMGSVSIRELQYFTGVTVSVIKALLNKGILCDFSEEVFRTPFFGEIPQQKEEITLTDAQQKAYEGLKQQMDAADGSTALLYGVTGSGKTQVFLRLVDDAVAHGKGVIVMVPEIALTPQMIRIFCSRYGKQIAVFHSAMSLGQRMDEYKRIAGGHAKVAIGTRSAVFAPVQNLGLIIMDEEQEHTYKSEKSPRFHARDVARFRAGYHHAMLCLASATPSVESFSAALSGKYRLYRLTERYGGAGLPSVKTVDMRKELANGNKGSISRALYEEISRAMENGKQAILLLNRRGHNTYITCPSCGYVASCPNCSVSLTYHSANGRMMCHYCGHSEPAVRICPQCGNEHIRYLGIGTQRVEEELQQLFPERKILRMDADSTMTRGAYTELLTAFGEHQYDIMLGTQMVAKGLDFPDVTVVGVVGADQALYSEDYRSFERTFSLLTQVIGRAGRSGGTGTAVVQTIDPQSRLIDLAQKQDYEAFYQQEILTRRAMIYPPYCDLCVVYVQSPQRETALQTLEEIFASMRESLKGDFTDVKVIVLGPAACAMPKINNRYRFRLTIKCKDNARFRAMLHRSIDPVNRTGVTVSVDMNPESSL